MSDFVKQDKIWARSKMGSRMNLLMFAIPLNYTNPPKRAPAVE